MFESKMINAISDCYAFCQAHTCPTCPKRDACSLIFDGYMVESDIYELSVKCRKLNEFKESKDYRG